ncbi:MAG: YbaK/EbsC family protein [Planctomycetes bacterium]|nr:YbaK/EbsC family protein [Planctomycetota bacterium]
MATSWVKDLLERRGIPYEELHHADAATASELAEIEHVSGHQVAKTVVVIADDRPFELVLPASRHVNFERVCSALQAREVRLATEEEIAELFSDSEPGAVPPLRHWRNVGVLMDQSMRVTGEIVFHAATHRDAVRLRFQDWFKLVNPRVARFSTIGQPTARAAYKPRAGELIGPGAEAGRIQQLLDDLLDILHLQAKEIERLTTHVEQQTDSLLQPSQMPLVASELSALRAKLHNVQ